MWKTFYIKSHERGILYYRGDFRRILRPGHYRRPWFGQWQIVPHDLSQPEAKIDNLELLLQTHLSGLQAHLQIVQTAFGETALVCLGQRWVSVAPNQLRAFWRGFVDVQIHRFNLEDSLELASEFVTQIRGMTIEGLKKVQLSESEIGLLYVQDNFLRPLGPGEYAFWTFSRKVEVRVFSQVNPKPEFPSEEVLIEQHPEFVATHCLSVQLDSDTVAIVRYKGKVIAILPPCSRKLFWQGVEIAEINVVAQPKLPQRLVAELVSGLTETLSLSYEALHLLEVPAQHVGLLYLDQVLQETLPPGLHAWWIFGRSFKTEAIDLRLQMLEISGQEILSRDKVPLRLNLTASFRVVNPILAKSALADIPGFLYKELQLGLRSAVGTRSLDTLLEDKGAIDASVADYIRPKVSDYGIKIESVGVKDIILPGEIKAILSKVVEAEKSAQANVVRRREETAATRSMLNTAKVMEDNPVALRLKELEVLERIAEKIDHINVNGGLESILTDLIQIKSQ
ncbi:MAG: slipin family protein [Aphanocapsa sp. GSE-SYN-MK-11-07L]|jgi:regulator of protease activity HflC (stomatin/prohibitin superfamily)|nr:slipin family protein [Aphanocapsa sp. GSE-SYN-MK-11-07L]